MGDRAMSDRRSIKAARIRELNDQLRCKALGGRIVITRGIEALGADGVREVLTTVARFDDFTEDNDPWASTTAPCSRSRGAGSSSRSIISTAICGGIRPTPATRQLPSGC